MFGRKKKKDIKKKKAKDFQGYIGIQAEMVRILQNKCLIGGYFHKWK